MRYTPTSWLGQLLAANSAVGHPMCVCVCVCMQVGGDITYNGVHMKDFVVERTASYIDQVGGWVRASTYRLH